MVASAMAYPCPADPRLLASAPPAMDGRSKASIPDGRPGMVAPADTLKPRRPVCLAD
jgi:hypothetical protein